MAQNRFRVHRLISERRFLNAAKCAHCFKHHAEPGLLAVVKLRLTVFFGITDGGMKKPFDEKNDNL